MLLFEDHSSQSTAIKHKAAVCTIAFSPDGSTLATGAKDGSVFLRDSSGQVSQLFERGPTCLPVHAIDYLPDTSSVIVGGDFGWTSWKQVGDEWKQTRPPAMGSITTLAVLNERKIAFGIGERLKPTAPGTFEIWDISADRKLLPYFHEPNGVRAIATCPAKNLVAWATGHRKVRVYDITSPSKPVDFPQPKDCPAIAISKDGSTLAVAVDYAVKVIDLEKKRDRLLMKGHKGPVSAVAFGPDGRSLVTGSWDGTTRIWDISTGVERATFDWRIGRVLCVTYAPDGLRLAAGGDLGHVVMWDAE